MTALDHFDPFLSAEPASDDPERITGGRYRLPDLTIGQEGELLTGVESRTGGWQRVTTLVKAISDAMALDLWHQRQMIIGFVLRQDLFDLACAMMSNGEPNRQQLDSLAAKVLSAAKSDEGANWGTAMHGLSEAGDRGFPTYARKIWHGKLTNYRMGLKAHRLSIDPRYIERRIVVLRYGIAGTTDRFLWDEEAGVYRVGDLKTQKAFWGWLEIAAQEAAYQMADAVWCRERRCYEDPPPLADDYGVVMWMPLKHLEHDDQVDMFNVDLERGRVALELAHKVVQLRSETGSKFQTWGTLRPLPDLTDVQTYALRLDSVATAAEGSALWAEIAGRGLADVPELKDLATEVAQRVAITT